MKTIIIGAGRGSRLEHLTNDQPKCFTEIHEKRILDWILETYYKNGIIDFTFIGGYLIDVIKKHYPEFTLRHNDNWENNNILQSLFYAEQDFEDGFISTYSDILYTPEIVRKLLKSKADITLAIDTDWLSRYEYRSQHPSSDGETVLKKGKNITHVNRDIADDKAFGEFIGVAKFSAKAAKILKQHYYSLSTDFKFEGKTPLNKAYLIHLLDYLLDKGIKIEYVTTPGRYIEIDTLEDYEYALKFWPKPDAIQEISNNKKICQTQPCFQPA